MTHEINTTDDLESFISDTFTQINDQVYCSIIDMNVDPGEAYEIVYIDLPTATDYIRPDFGVDFNSSELVSDEGLVFATL